MLSFDVIKNNNN